MVDIVIPAYNAHDTLERTLISITTQTMYKELKVILVDDNSKEDYNSIIDKFKDIIDIRYFRLEKNIGPGAVRQFGIDNSNSAYIMFVDADDILTDALAIKGMYDYLTKNHNCVLVSASFLEEKEDDRLVPHDNDMVWLFAKLYRRSFLQKNKIIISSKYFYEDLEFNTKVRLRLEPDEYVQFLNDKVVYIWKFKEDSITRRNNFEFTYHQGVIESINAKIRALEIPNASQKIAKEEIMTLVFNMYNNYNLLTNDRPEEKEWLEEALNTMINFWDKKGRSVFSSTSENERNKYFSRTRNKSSRHIIPKITLSEFINILEQKIKEKT
jgi:glycosyltransferase involved in cell wall biosynthesis